MCSLRTLRSAAEIDLHNVGAQHLGGSGSGRPESVESADQGRLARTRQAHDDEDLAGLDLEARIDDGGRTEFRQVITVGASFESSDDFVFTLSENFVDV